ncbi:MAG TPA: hypothetical protein VEF04_11450 [Blastocatellia bacterium]|nr:hypothetical protein [Blastocatellia bacterium]
MLDPRSGRAIDSLRRDPLQVMEAAGMIYFLYPDSIERAPRHSIHELDRLRYYERPFSFPLERMATNGRDRIAISAFDSVWLVDTSYTLIARAEILWRGSKLAVVGDSLYLIDTAISLLKAGGKLLHLHSLGGSLVSTITIQDTGFFFTINTGWDEEALYRFDARDNRLTLHATELAPARWLYHPTDGELWSIDRRGSINKYSVGQPLAKLDPPIETDDHQHLVTSFGVLNNTLKISFRDCEFGLVEVFDLLGRPLGMGALEQEVEINLNGVSDALLLKCTSIAGSHLHRLKVR